MPQESAELPQFFETVEKLYLMYEVPDEVQAKLLIPLLTTQAKSLVNRMSVDGGTIIAGPTSFSVVPIFSDILLI